MRVAILGAGAMGSWFGGQLAEQGHEVQLLTTNRQHIDAIRKNGLVMQIHGGGCSDVTVRLEAQTPADYEGRAELIIVLTKSYQTLSAMQAISPKLDQGTAILTLQNGLGNADAIGKFVKPANIWLGMSMMPVDRIAPGVVASRGVGPTIFGHINDKYHPFTESIVEAFDRTEMSVAHDPDVQSRIWEKVAFNCSMNALCALTHGTPGTVGQLPDSRSMLQAIATEVADVAAAEGISISLDSIFDTIAYACTHHGEHKASMLQDLLSGKPTEVDALNGAIVSLATRHGVQTPLNTTLTTLVRLAELGDHSQSNGLVS